MHAAPMISGVISKSRGKHRECGCVKGYGTAASSSGISGQHAARKRELCTAAVRQNNSTSKLSSAIPKKGDRRERRGRSALLAQRGSAVRADHHAPHSWRTPHDAP